MRFPETLLAAVWSILWTGIFLPVYSQDAATILNQMDEVMFAPKDMTANYRITLIDRNGKEEVREAVIQQKGTDRRMFRFTAPASQAGIAVLSLPGDVMYLYLPAYGKERRIATSIKNQNFAGTDFSYYDMESMRFSDKYNPALLQTTADAYILELTPKTSSEYSRVVTRVNRTHFYPELMEYYDRSGKKIKEARYTFKKVGNYWNSEVIEMTDLRKNHRTVLRMSDVKYDTGLKDDDFTVRKLVQ